MQVDLDPDQLFTASSTKLKLIAVTSLTNMDKVYIDGPYKLLEKKSIVELFTAINTV